MSPLNPFAQRHRPRARYPVCFQLQTPVFVGEALIGEPVGIFETESGDWLVRYADVELGYIHSQRRRLSPRPPRWVSRPGDLIEIAGAIPTTP